MTDFEFKNAIFPMLVSAYPRYCAGLDAGRKAGVVAMWMSAFWNDDVRVVEAALQSFANTDDKGFPPCVGQIRERIFMLFGRNELTEAEAWNLVLKAVRQSDYADSAKEAFAKLPPTLQRLVGDAGQLRAWSQMDKETLHSVVASNFQRSYKTAAEKERAYNVLPPHMRESVDRLAAARTVSALEGGVGNG